MGTLTPGVNYIYERANGIIYAREFGKTERQIIGYDTELSPEKKLMTFWNDVLSEAEHNPALQKALDNAIMIYRLSKDNPL